MSATYIKIARNKEDVFSKDRVKEYDKERFDKFIIDKGICENDKFIMYEDEHNIYLKVKR